MTEKNWPHAPIHKLNENGIFIVTGATLYKAHLFNSPEKLSLVENQLLTLSKQYGWQLEAWAIFANHYHYVCRSQPDSKSLKRLISHFHTATATQLNKVDQIPGRKVWFNYWDTQLTFQKSYLARLCYVHQNPVKHGLVVQANQYQWCSAAWFERTCSKATVHTIYSFKVDAINLKDDF